MKIKFLCCVLALLIVAGCKNKASEQASTPASTAPAQNAPQAAPKTDSPKENKKDEAAFKPFYVYADKGSKENHYIPSGFMPDGKCLALNDAWAENCHNGKTCMKIVYDVECSKQDQQWAGIYWLNPANNWGRMKGGYNLTGAQKMTFWAKGEIGGEQIQEFTIGGIEGDYPDSDKIVIGPVILSNEWKEYTVDLRGRDLSYISGGFAWSTEVAANPENCVFYLDEIRFE